MGSLNDLEVVGMWELRQQIATQDYMHSCNYFWRTFIPAIILRGAKRHKGLLESREWRGQSKIRLLKQPGARPAVAFTLPNAACTS